MAGATLTLSGPLDAAQLELLNPRLHILSSDPGSPVEGQIWYRSDTQEFRLRKNSTTVTLASGLDTEAVQDIIGAMVSGNTETGISVTYDDASGVLNFVAEVTQAELDTVSGSIPTTEQIQDIVGAMFSSNTETRIAVTYDDSDGTIDLVVDAIPSTEDIQDVIGGMVTGNTETGIAVTYDDSDGTLDFVVGALNTLPAPTGDLALASNKITGLADGTATTDAATFGQLSAVVNSKSLKDTVDAATTAALPAVTATTTTLTANANGALAAQDGVTLAAGDDLLVKDQAAGAQNGIYTVTTVGNGSTPFVLTRRGDADSASELTNATVLVDAGTVAKGDIYTFPTITTLGTTDATPVKTGEGNTVYTADGTTLTLTGTQFSVSSGGITGTQLAASVAGNGLTGGGGSALAVNTDGTTIEVSSDAVRIAASAAGAGLTGGGASALAVGAGTGITVNANDVAVDTSVVVRKYATTVGDGAATSYVLTHNLGTRDVTVSVRRNSSPYDGVLVGWEATTTNTVTLYFAVAPTSNQYAAVITG